MGSWHAMLRDLSSVLYSLSDFRRHRCLRSVSWAHNTLYGYRLITPRYKQGCAIPKQGVCMENLFPDIHKA